MIDGVIVAMAPPAIPPQIIAGNLTGEIYAALRANRPDCTVRSQAGIAFVKLPQYQAIPSLREILYIESEIESERVAATVYRRNGEGRTASEIDGPASRLQLATIGLDIPLGGVYRGVPGLSPA